MLVTFEAKTMMTQTWLHCRTLYILESLDEDLEANVQKYATITHSIFNFCLQANHL